MLSSVTPCASHTTLTMNQNRLDFVPYSFEYRYLDRICHAKLLDWWRWWGEDGGEGGDASGGVSGNDHCRICCLIKLIVLLGESQVHSSSLTRKGKIKGLFPNPLILL